MDSGQRVVLEVQMDQIESSPVGSLNAEGLAAINAAEEQAAFRPPELPGGIIDDYTVDYQEEPRRV